MAFSPVNYRQRYARRAIKTKLLLILVVNLVAAVLCAVYISSSYPHWKLVDAHHGQLNYPDLDIHDLKKGTIAAIGRIVWAFVLVVSGVFAPILVNLLFLVIGLAWEIQLGTIADNNFGYLVSVGYGKIYPVSGNQCTSWTLSESQKSFYTAIGGITGQDPAGVCSSFASEGLVLQIYVVVGLVAAFMFLILAAMIGCLSASRRESGKSSMMETAFSYLSAQM